MTKRLPSHEPRNPFGFFEIAPREPSDPLYIPAPVLEPMELTIPCAACVARQAAGEMENPLHPCCASHARSVGVR